MATDLEYALLAANVYGNKGSVKHPRNTLPTPTGWTEVARDVSWNGFMANAYRNGNEIIIAYAGTTGENPLDWPLGNLTGALGLPRAGTIFAHGCKNKQFWCAGAPYA